MIDYEGMVVSLLSAVLLIVISALTSGLVSDSFYYSAPSLMGHLTGICVSWGMFLVSQMHLSHKHDPSISDWDKFGGSSLGVGLYLVGTIGLLLYVIVFMDQSRQSSANVTINGDQTRGSYTCQEKAFIATLLFFQVSGLTLWTTYLVLHGPTWEQLVCSCGLVLMVIGIVWKTIAELRARIRIGIHRLQIKQDGETTIMCSRDWDDTTRPAAEHMVRESHRANLMVPNLYMKSRGHIIAASTMQSIGLLVNIIGVFVV